MQELFLVFILVYLKYCLLVLFYIIKVNTALEVNTDKENDFNFVCHESCIIQILHSLTLTLGYKTTFV